MVVVPPVRKVSVLPLTEATEGKEEANETVKPEEAVPINERGASPTEAVAGASVKEIV